MKLFRAKKEEEAVRQEIAVKETAPFEGLTEAEAAARDVGSDGPVVYDAESKDVSEDGE